MKWLSLVLVLVVSIIQNCYANSLVIVVSANSKVNQLSQNDVEQIFLDKAEFFPDGETAVPVNYAESSAAFPLRDIFQKKVLGKSSNQIRAYWSRLVFTGTGKLPREVFSTRDLSQILSSTPGAIGYIDEGLFDKQTMKIVYKMEN